MKILTYKDVTKAAKTLYDSFRQDSLSQLLTSDAVDGASRRAIEIKLYECYLKQHINHGICLGINESSDCFETVAIWATPTSEADGLNSFSNLMESDFHHLYQMCDPVTRKKIFTGLLPLLHDSFDNIIMNDSRFKTKGVWTLVYLGSLASSRGKGNVRKMFEFMFKNYIDTDDTTICYLESSSPMNIPIYERFGFNVYQDILLGSRSHEHAIEGKDFAIMNVMIRGNKGHNWMEDENTLGKLGKL